MQPPAASPPYYSPPAYPACTPVQQSQVRRGLPGRAVTLWGSPILALVGALIALLLIIAIQPALSGVSCPPDTYQLCNSPDDTPTVLHMLSLSCAIGATIIAGLFALLALIGTALDRYLARMHADRATAGDRRRCRCSIRFRPHIPRLTCATIDGVSTAPAGFRGTIGQPRLHERAGGANTGRHMRQPVDARKQSCRRGE
jgi:hypothetical protein